jgi:hypothetical protein
MLTLLLEFVFYFILFHLFCYLLLFLDNPPQLIIVMSRLLSGAGDGTLSTGLPATSLSGRSGGT